MVMKGQQLPSNALPWLMRFCDDPRGADVAMRYYVLWHRPYEATCSNFLPDICLNLHWIAPA